MRFPKTWGESIIQISTLGLFFGISAVMVPGSANAAAPTKVTVGQAFVAPAAAGFWVGRDRGLFAKYGLDATIVRITGSTQAVQALLAGEIQFMLGAPAQGFSAVAAGADLLSIATLGPKMPYLLVARPPIQTAADLKGKQVGVSSAGLSSDRVALLIALKQLKLDPQRDGISLLVTGPQTQRVQALLAGRIDASNLDPLQRAIAERSGMVVVSDLAALGIPWDHDVVLLERRFAKSHPEVVEAILKGLLEANAFILSPANKRAVMPILAKELKLDREEDIELAYNITLSLYVVKKPYPSTKAAEALIEAVRSDFPQLARVSLETHIDLSFMKKLDESGFIDQLYR